MKTNCSVLIFTTIASAAAFLTGCQPGDDPTLLSIRVTVPPDNLIYEAEQDKNDGKKYAEIIKNKCKKFIKNNFCFIRFYFFNEFIC